MFGFVFLIDLVAIAVAWLDEKISPAQSVAGFAVFGLLAFWTANSLSNELLNAGAGVLFHFRRSPFGFARVDCSAGVARPSQNWANHLFPMLALALVLVPVFKLAEVSFIVWPFVLLVDLLAIALAALTATLLPVLAVLVLTLAATGALIFKIPADLTGLPTSFFLLGAFAVFFVAARHLACAGNSSPTP